jgi:3-deoxy-D-manno-octulosonic-acid transferase
MGVPADRVSVTGSVKWDGADVADTIAGADVMARAMGLRADQPMWVAGSTGPGEEAILLDAFKQLRERHPELQLVIVPRKPERFEEVADLIGKAGFQCVRRSKSPDNGEQASCPPSPAGGRASFPPSSLAPSPGNGPACREMQDKAGGMPASRERVFLGDTMGELRKLYCMASVVFVGRSLAAMGGSDTMEVAALAKPIIVGPHNENFADTIAQLQRGQAIRILSADLDDGRTARQMVEAVDEMLTNPAEAQAMGRRGREVVLANRGATRRTLDVLMEMLNRAQHRTA